jgi:hypothetical protein
MRCDISLYAYLKLGLDEHKPSGEIRVWHRPILVLFHIYIPDFSFGSDSTRVVAEEVETQLMSESYHLYPNMQPSCSWASSRIKGSAHLSTPTFIVALV